MGVSRPLPVTGSDGHDVERDDTRHIRVATDPRPAALDIFLAWLIWLPQDRDIASAAAQEIRKIDPMSGDRTTRELREMLEDVARSGRLN
jgi:hypothetical protein